MDCSNYSGVLVLSCCDLEPSFIVKRKYQNTCCHRPSKFVVIYMPSNISIKVDLDVVLRPTHYTIYRLRGVKIIRL